MVGGLEVRGLVKSGLRWCCAGLAQLATGCKGLSKSEAQAQALGLGHGLEQVIRYTVRSRDVTNVTLKCLF